ncbi:tetratricopeptide repeat protein [Amycolatopsis sp. NBC_00345]|uniref:tetratricopeptide repeat protein n=1 Tax=Amycolatopsis sp. NBC_00345 TaxID=2975955 RepID=UPI002E26A87C
MAAWQDVALSEMLKAAWAAVAAGARTGVVRLGSAVRGRVVRRRSAGRMDRHISSGVSAPDGMIDRKLERRELDEASSRSQQVAGQVVQLCGPDGIGKSSLQSWNGERNQSRYRNGRISIDWLDWVSPIGKVREEDLLAYLLGAAGVPGTLVESGLSARRRQWREVLSRQRVQIEVDNARDSPALAKLLVPTHGSILIVAATRPLEAFATMSTRIIRLTGVEPKHATRIMAAICGKSALSAEPEAAAELIRCCDGVPRTLRRAANLVNERVALVGAGAVSSLVAEIRTKGVTAALEINRAGTAAGIREISDDARVLLALLAAHPDSSVALDDVKYAWQNTRAADDVVSLIAQLHRHNLLEIVAPARYRTTSVVRDCMRREFASHFIVDELWWPMYYCDRAQYADLTLNEYRMRLWQLSVLPEDSPFIGWRTELVLGAIAASLPAQRAVIEDAAKCEDSQMVARIIGALESLLITQGHHDFFLEVLAVGVRVARGAEDRVTISRMLCQQAWILLERGKISAARACLDEAMSLAEAVGNDELMASVCEYESRYQRAVGRLDRAVGFLDKAIEFDDRIEGPKCRRSRGIHARMKADCLVEQGKSQVALEALELADANTLSSDGRNQSRVCLVYGKAYILLGRFNEASSSLDTAQGLVEKSGSRARYERELTEVRGDLASAQAKSAAVCNDAAQVSAFTAEAIRCWTIVRDLYRLAAHSKADEFQNRIDDLLRAT